MPFGEIRAIDLSCPSYRPGHQVHWIQAKKSVDEQQQVINVSVVVRDDGRIDIVGDELNLTMWNHDPGRLRSALDYCGRAVWKPRYHVLSLPGSFGFVFNPAALDQQTPCKPGADKAAPPPLKSPTWLACCGRAGRSRPHTVVSRPEQVYKVAFPNGRDPRRAAPDGIAVAFP